MSNEALMTSWLFKAMRPLAWYEKESKTYRPHLNNNACSVTEEI